MLTALVVAWAAIAVQSWLYALVVAAVGVADLPLVVRVGVRRRTTVALLLHARCPDRRVVRGAARVGAVCQLGMNEAACDAAPAS